jgi:4-aminobutyrate aminotransferase
MSSIALRTEVPGPRSRELAARRAAVVPRGLVSATPIFVQAARGATITDVDDNVFLDFAGGIGTLNVGSTQPEVVDAIKNQVERFLHTAATVVMYEGYVRVAEALVRLAPGQFQKSALLLNSGAEAIENAVKIARHATGRSAIIVFSHAFHGRTLLTMSMSAKYSTYKAGFGPFAPEVYRLPFPDEYRDVSSRQAIEAFHEALYEEVGADKTAAVVVELVQGEGGFLVAPPDFIAEIREVCSREGILLVVDEVQSGFWRTGRFLASEHYGLEPDLVCLGKSLAAGLPLSAVVGRSEVMDSAQPGGLGGTFAGNPVSCAAALVALDLMERPEFTLRAQAVGEIVRREFDRWHQEIADVGCARGLGAMAAVELVSDRGTKEPATNKADRVLRWSYEHGLITLKAGTYGNIIRFLAPFAVTNAELGEGLAVLEAAIRDA